MIGRLIEQYDYRATVPPYEAEYLPTVRSLVWPHHVIHIGGHDHIALEAGTHEGLNER
jgi:hypothetical protein